MYVIVQDFKGKSIFSIDHDDDVVLLRNVDITELGYGSWYLDKARILVTGYNGYLIATYFLLP